MAADVDVAPLRELIEGLHMQTKARLVTGAGVWWTAEEPSIGLSFVLTDLTTQLPAA